MPIRSLRFHGKHTLGFGVDYRHWTLTRNLDDDFLGTWGYSSTLINSNSEPISPTNPLSSCSNAPVSVSGGAPAPLCGTGNSLADMILGYYSGTSEYVPGPFEPDN